MIPDLEVLCLTHSLGEATEVVSRAFCSRILVSPRVSASCQRDLGGPGEALMGEISVECALMTVVGLLGFIGVHPYGLISAGYVSG